ncbi:hypothetical protein EXIGLDRAFT_750911 [Exidia glandulosa HHB12029]|uniref:MYND-type domain-containing protein n=1 Tax=Exidia glandulosa HHB12029 TaxID=1314781 RepID=A0A165G3M3_EXIGL|nr:hypothetical protein EXIGLDRAFT_750911 [Exidia glandulosa HHB12029]
MDRLVNTINADAENIVRQACSANETASSLSMHAQIFTQAPEGTHPLPADALLRIFLWHTSADKAPRMPARPPVENDTSERAWACFLALCHIRFIGKLPQNELWLNRYCDSWLGLFKWSVYFFAQRVQGAPSPDQALAAHMALSELLVGLLHNPRLQSAMIATPGVIDLAGNLWGYRSPPRPLGRFAEILAASIIPRLLTNGTIEQLNEFCSAATTSDVDAVAKLAMKRLKRSVHSPAELLEKKNAQELHAHAVAIVILTRLPLHPLTATLLRDNVTWVMTSALVNVARAIDLHGSADLRRTPDLIDCVNAGFTFLRYALLRSDSYRWVAQSLDAGLLEAIAALCLVVEHMDLGPASVLLRDALKAIIHETLPKHMVYKSVLKVARREIDEVPHRHVQERVRASSINTYWEVLKNLLTLRSTIAEIEILQKGMATCDSLTCLKAEKKTQLKRCAGCQYVYYCSKDCQVAAWPDHKRMCKLKGESLKGPGKSRMFLESDVAFIRKLVGTDAYAHLPRLRRIAKRDNPNEPGENFVICIDYTDPEYPAGKCSMKNIRTYQFSADMRSQAADPENVDGQNEEMISMVRKAPKSWTFIENTFTLGEQKITRNLMLRQNIWIGGDSKLEHAMNWQHHQAKFACPNARHGLPSMLENTLGDLLDLSAETVSDD